VESAPSAGVALAAYIETHANKSAAAAAANPSVEQQQQQGQLQSTKSLHSMCSSLMPPDSPPLRIRSPLRRIPACQNYCCCLCSSPRLCNMRPIVLTVFVSLLTRDQPMNRGLCFRA
jgi:hypothetical protein